MEQIRPRGALGYAKQSPDLAMTEALYVVQDDDRPLAFRELSEGAAEPGPQVSALGRVAGRQGEIVGQGVGFADATAAGQIERCVGDDAVQPRTKRLSRKEPVEGSIGVEEPVLYRVLGVFVCCHDGPSD